VIEQETEESFAALFEESLKTERRTVQPGEKVSGKVFQVGAERVLVDLGGGLDGIIELGELAEKGEEATVKVGDTVEAYVLRIENRVAILGKTLGKGVGSRRALEDAARSGVPVEGLVTGVNKGGYEVEAAGMRCFCPLGQMDTRRIEDPATMVGRRLLFRVAEFRGSRDVVLSRRQLLEAEAAEKAKATRERLVVGERFTGVVTNVRDFGLFVDIGGIEGLVPAAELGYGRLRPQDVAQVGQTVEVELKQLQPPEKGGPKGETKERITLSMRALAPDPWEQVVADLPEGTVVRGTVTRIQPYGAFVQIVPGVEGLLHVSAFGRRVKGPEELVAVDQEIAIRIDSVDFAQRRLSLSFITEEEAAALAKEYADASGTPLVPAPAPAPAAAKPAAVLGRAEKRTVETSHAGGMRVRRTTEGGEKAAAKVAEKAPEPAVSAPASGEGKARVLGRASAKPVSESEKAERLSAAPSAPRAVAGPRMGEVLEAAVDKIETFGLFVSFGSGRGLVPFSELPVPKGADLRKSYPVGTKLKVAVVDVRPDGKVRLSVNAAAQAEERAEALAWQQTQKPVSGKGFGTMAELLAKFRK
jgi:small subunit ribosomal protein S1